MYKVVSKWCGWWGGWGSESDVAGFINAQASEGWRLISTKASICAWWWFVPRKKLLLILERAAASAT